MEILFYISIGFLLLNFIISLKPRLLTLTERYIAGIFYFLFCITFLIVVYLYKHSIWFVLLAILLLIIFMYLIQIVTGAISRMLMKLLKIDPD